MYGRNRDKRPVDRATERRVPSRWERQAQFCVPERNVWCGSGTQPPAQAPGDGRPGNAGFAGAGGGVTAVLVAFDFHASLSTHDVTTLLGEEFDPAIADEIAGLSERAVDGEIDLADSLRQRVRLLEGMPEERAVAAFDRVRLRPGAADLLGALQRADVRVAVITGSFERGVRAALDRERAVVDDLVANRLPVENGALTGEVEGPLVEGTKDEALDRIAVGTGIGPGETIAVGDDATDLPMLQVAGDAVGFRPTPLVEPHCDAVVQSIDDLELLFEQRGIA